MSLGLFGIFCAIPFSLSQSISGCQLCLTNDYVRLLLQRYFFASIVHPQWIFIRSIPSRKWLFITKYSIALARSEGMPWMHVCVSECDCEFLWLRLLFIVKRFMSRISLQVNELMINEPFLNTIIIYFCYYHYRPPFMICRHLFHWLTNVSPFFVSSFSRFLSLLCIVYKQRCDTFEF